MAGSARLREQLLALVPDAPVWIEARAALLEPTSHLFGDEAGYVIRSDRLRLAAIGGLASASLIRAALGDIGAAAGLWAVTMPEWSTAAATAALSTWVATDAEILREPAQGLRKTRVDSPTEVRLMAAPESSVLDGLPVALGRELRGLSARTDLAVAWVDGRPVSFCHAACETRTLWDVSINTLAGYRRRGLATATAAFLAALMRARGKRAVWGAHRHNVASLRLAETLGFEPSGRLELFETEPLEETIR